MPFSGWDWRRLQGLESGPVMADKSFKVARQKRGGKHSFNLGFEEIMVGKDVRIDQGSTKLIEYVRRTGYIKEPSSEPYNLVDPNNDPSVGQSRAVMKVLKNMTNGFFVECGALDGELRSNTLYLEKELGWTGLLIEADPSMFKLVMKKNRKAWATNVCLAIHEYPHQVMFHQEFKTGKISSVEIFESKEQQPNINTLKNLVRVQCLPFFTLLSTMNIYTIDYFSLDVEGNEFDVLKTIPFDKILVRVLSVEYIHDKVAPDTIENFMKGKGYRVETKIIHDHPFANDFIFVHESVK